MTNTDQPFDRKVIAKIPRKYDVEIHVCVVTVEDKKYVDLREFIPSLEQYGRGLLVPAESLQATLDGMVDVREIFEAEAHDAH